MSVALTIDRGGWRMQAVEGALNIARSEWSDWITVRLADLPQFIADLNAAADFLAQPNSPIEVRTCPPK